LGIYVAELRWRDVFSFFKKLKHLFKKKSENSLELQFQRTFEPLLREGSAYYISKKVDYRPERIFKQETVEKVFNSACFLQLYNLLNFLSDNFFNR
jgi:hypothetical protein